MAMITIKMNVQTYNALQPKHRRAFDGQYMAFVVPHGWVKVTLTR